MPAFTRGTSQPTHAGINGPGHFNLDATLSKSIAVNERVKVSVDLTADNALNGFTTAGPATDVFNKGTFGTTTTSGQLYGCQTSHWPFEAIDKAQ
jgi:hypothetical protein